MYVFKSHKDALCGCKCKLLNDLIDINSNINNLIDEADISMTYFLFYDVLIFHQIVTLQPLIVHDSFDENPTT